MKNLPRIVIISNAHKADDVRLYHKIGKSLCQIANVFVIGARGVGSLSDNPNDASEIALADETAKPVRMIASGTTPNLRLFSLYRETLKIKPEVVICIEPLTMLVGLLVRRKTGCRLVYDAHEYYAAQHGEKYSFPFNTLVSALYFVVEKMLQSQMDLTLAVNEDIFKLFNLRDTEDFDYHTGSGTHKRGKQGVVITNYPTKEIWKDNLSDCGVCNLLPDTQFDTIYLGGLSEDRGIMKLLQVVEILHIQYPQFKALFVGRFISEEFKARFFDYVMDNNLNSHVFWRDSVPPDKVCAIMNQVKIGLSLMHPHYKRYRTTLNLKILEYLAAGVPVVVNDFPQLQTIIRDNKLGYCVSFHKKDIAEAIIRLMKLTETENKALSERCRSFIKNRYMWDYVEPVLLKKIQLLLN